MLRTVTNMSTGCEIELTAVYNFYGYHCGRTNFYGLVRKGE